MRTITDLSSSFKNPDLVKLALTHRSWINENDTDASSNERLEFLGDAIIEFVVSDKIYHIYPDKEEGFLTALRSSLVNTISLSKVSKAMGIGEALLLSKGEESGKGRENPSLLADAFEAIIGALYLDNGIESVKKFLDETLLSSLSDITVESLKDPKSSLQEYVQSLGQPTPKYKVIKEIGPDHAKQFDVEVIINSQPIAIGTGKSKSEAEQAAAQAALAAITPKR